MSVFAISDLHLHLNNPEKSMSLFGSNWANHHLKIKENWNSVVKNDDLVLICGDISWALKLEESLNDFLFINELNGKKIIIKGNHDYWWTTLAKINKFFEKNKINITLLQHSVYIDEKFIISGIRGWEYSDSLKESDLNHYEKEIYRFNLGMTEVLKHSKDDSNKKIIFLFHYPPFYNEFQETPLLNEILKHNIDFVIFGHLHDIRNPSFYNKIINNTQFYLTSCDLIDFKPIQII